jgi:uracil-DNA glycosylase family 4
VKLHQAVVTCTRCGLSSTRTNAVPGTGPCPADIMIVGEAPGFNEDMQGRPFVGQAGKLLDTLLAGIGLDRGDVYITNVLKCRPPQNRDPMPNEAEACAPYLDWQLKLVQPKVVVVLGRHALERLLPGHGPISRVRGLMVERQGTRYVPVYHPAAALHNGSLLGDLRSDFEKVGEYVRSVVRVVPAPPPASPPPSSPPPSQAPKPASGGPAAEQLSLI